MSYLAELHAALVQDSLEEQLEQPVPAGLEPGLAQLPVGGDELCHHVAGLLEAVYPGRAGVPVLVGGGGAVPDSLLHPVVGLCDPDVNRCYNIKLKYNPVGSGDSSTLYPR